MAGVGGGSHVYANTLYVPPRKFFDAPEWAGITNSRAASGHHPDPWRVAAGSGEDPAHTGICVDHLWRLARPGSPCRAGVA